MQAKSPFAPLGASVVLALAGCGGGSPSKPTATRFEGAAYPPGVTAPDFRLRDQRGRTVTLSGQRGRVVLLTFLNSDCRACALVAQQVRGALDELDSPASPAGASTGVSTIFVSTDPHADTRARVARFLAAASLTGRSVFLSGDRRQLEAVWRAYRIVPVLAGRTRSETAVSVLLIDKAGAERDAFGLEQITPEALGHDIRLLEAG